MSCLPPESQNNREECSFIYVPILHTFFFYCDTFFLSTFWISFLKTLHKPEPDALALPWHHTFQTGHKCQGKMPCHFLHLVQKPSLTARVMSPSCLITWRCSLRVMLWNGCFPCRFIPLELFVSSICLSHSLITYLVSLWAVYLLAHQRSETLATWGKKIP